MSIAPKTVNANELAQACFLLLNNNNISQVIVVEDNEYAGMVHIHDLIKEGLAD